MSEEEILQISNDISENDLSPKVTKAQLVEVIKYFRNDSDKNAQAYALAKCEVVTFLAHWISK